MEEEAEDGGAHALLPGDGGLHHRLDGAVDAGARVGVEARGQLRRRGAGEREEQEERHDAAAPLISHTTDARVVAMVVLWR